MLNKLKLLAKNKYFYILIIYALIAAAILVYKLASLTGGITSGELDVSTAKYGWHGLYNSIYLMPLTLIRSIINFFFHHKSILSLRLANILLGYFSVLFYGAIVYLWHGKRTAVLSTILFMCSAFTLHVSRLASTDVVYLFGILALLASHAAIYRKPESKLATIFNFFVWGLLLTIPGFIYFVIIDTLLQREVIINAFEENTELWLKIVSVVSLIFWLPLVIKDVLKVNSLKLYLGLPTHFTTVSHTFKNLAAVFIHLFIRGPQYPDVWLGKLPIFDFFTLAMILAGIFFYIQHYKSSRSFLLAICIIISVILIGLSGPVNFSLIYGIFMVIASTGIAYMLHLWLKVFPSNPLARNLGIGLLSLAILAACLYNLRAYFIAWPHNDITKQTFSHHL